MKTFMKIIMYIFTFMLVGGIFSVSLKLGQGSPTTTLKTISVVSCLGLLGIWLYGFVWLIKYFWRLVKHFVWRIKGY